MDGSSFEHRPLVDWDEGDVHAWLSKLGFPQYEHQIREHHICGDVLYLLDHNTLNDVGVTSIGVRIAILKALYLLKVENNIPIEPDHYVPPSEMDEREERVSIEQLYEMVREQSDRVRTLEEENRRLSDGLHSCHDDIASMRASSKPTAEAESPVQRSSSFKWPSLVKPSRSPTKPVPDVTESPQSSPQQYDFNLGSRAGTSSASDKRAQQTSSVNSTTSTLVNTPSSYNPPTASTSTSLHPTSSLPRPSRQESSDNLKSFKVSLDDPAWKVLPAALKKYKINNDDWQNYAMFICYGSPGNRIERCLSYDEKPLLLFQKLKDAKKNPVFMLKHIKDIRSPIAVAQQKQAARKANSDTSSVKSPPFTGASNQTHGPSAPSHERTRPPMLHVTSNLTLTGVAPGMMSALPGGQSGWPEVMSPAVESKGGEDGDTPKAHHHGHSSSHGPDGSDTGHAVVREIPPSTGVSYAVAIYPYMAEQEDEFDVVVGDTFIILSRARGWWVVQRDPAGSGLIEPDVEKQGWVPAGCLLETNVPVATAMADATARAGPSPDDPPASPPGTTPILPLSILSTSFPGIALMEYKKKGDEELDLAKDDSLRVFKRYNHWSYAVKEDTGDRGWVPSWFIGKVPTTTNVPPTPSSGGAPLNFGAGSVSLDGDMTGISQQAQVSPMSSAFPPMQSSRTTTVL